MEEKGGGVSRITNPSDHVIHGKLSFSIARPSAAKCLIVCVAVVACFVSSSVVGAWNLPASVNIHSSKQVLISVDLNHVARRAVPKEIFGFNIPWANFQRGYWRNQQVRPEVIEWLKPFYGAVYRYPGGEISNWFEWQKTVGAVASRERQYSNSGRQEKAEFGFDEYLDFVKAVNGLPLVTVNLKGTKSRIWDDVAVTRNNVKWVQYAIDREGAVDDVKLSYCQEGKKCPVQWWELGNELDWGKGAWSPDRYAQRAYNVGSEMLKVDPSLKLIAQTATAPWNKGRILKTPARKFDRTVGQALNSIAYGYAYHPYYDGMSIPEVNRYLKNVINNFSEYDSGGLPAIFVTEHARWPKKPLFGDWKDNWGQTGNLGGAIATVDFLLSQMTIPNVRAAMWHALGAWGPWQLFYVNSNNDSTYPNVVYWGLRVTRQGLLDDAIKTHVSSPNLSNYSGGYDVRALFMRSRDGERYSLMTVNRSGEAQKARLNIPSWAGRSFNVRHYFITGKSKAEENRVGDENRVTMRDELMTVGFDVDGQAIISLPAFSVSSFLFESMIDR